MPCDDRRQYIVPPISGDVAQLPTVPAANNWVGLQGFLQAVKNVLEGASTNPIRPGAIQNFTVGTTDSGTQLVWDPDKDSAFYAVYRHSDNVFAHSRVIATVHASGGSQRPGFFDVAGQDEVLATRVYWVRGFSATGVPGPISTQTITVDSGIIPGDRPWTETLTPGEVRLVEQNNADPVVIRSYGTATPSLVLYRANGTEDAPTAITTGDELGQVMFGGLGQDAVFMDLAKIIATTAAEPVDTPTYVSNQQQLGGDSLNGSWSSAGKLVISSICVVGDDLFVGVCTTSTPGTSVLSGSLVYRYTISTATWTNITQAGTQGWITNIVHYNGKIFYGVKATNTTGVVWQYDIASGVSTDLGAPSRPYNCMTVDPATGDLYLGDLGIPSTVRKYTLATTTWSSIWSTYLGTTGSDVIYAIEWHAGTVYMSIEYNPNPSPVASRVYQYSGSGSSWNLEFSTSADVVRDLQSFASYLYWCSDLGVVNEWNPLTSTNTPIGGGGINSSWTSVGEVFGMCLSPDGGTLYACLTNGSSRGEIWHFTPSFGGLVAGTWRLFDTANVAYNTIYSIATDSGGNVYSGMGNGSADGEFWGMGTVVEGPIGFTNLAIQVSEFGTMTTVGTFFYNGDIAFGEGLDRIYWDESADMLGIKTTSPTRTLDLAGTDGMHMAIGSPTTPASGDIYLATTTGILTWHDGTDARRTVHAPAALTTLNLVKGSGGVTGVQTTGIAISSVDAATGFTLLGLEDTDASHNLSLKWNENDAANRTLNILVGGATRSLTFTADATIGGTNSGDVTLAGTPDYITISNQIITRGLIDLATDVTGDLPFANIVPATAASVLFGRGSAGGAGDWQEITLGSNLTMTGTVLSATGGGGGGSGSTDVKEAQMSGGTATVTTEQDLAGATLSLDQDGVWFVTAAFDFEVEETSTLTNIIGYINFDGVNEAETSILQVNTAGSKVRATVIQTAKVTVASQPKTVKLRAAATGDTAKAYNDGTTIKAVFFGVADHVTTHEDGGTDELDIANIGGLSGLVDDVFRGDGSFGAYSNGVSGFRLTGVTGRPAYCPRPAVPSATDTGAETCDFATAHNWVTGTIITPNATVGGLTTGTKYYIRAVDSDTVSFHTTLADAIAGTSPVNLTASVTSTLLPSGVEFKTLYWTPWVNSRVLIYTGSKWVQLTLSELSLALSSLTSGKNYDVFLNYNSGTPALELSAAWTDDTTRADALALQDGVWVKSGATTRLWLGTIRTTGTDSAIVDFGGGVYDRGGKIYLWNTYNRLRAPLGIFLNRGNASYNYTLATIRQMNADSNMKVEYICGIEGGGHASLRFHLYGRNSSAGQIGQFGFGTDSTLLYDVINSNSGYLRTEVANQGTAGTAFYDGPMYMGYHAINLLESATASGTFSWFPTGIHQTNTTGGGLLTGVRGWVDY